MYIYIDVYIIYTYIYIYRDTNQATAADMATARLYIYMYIYIYRDTNQATAADMATARLAQNGPHEKSRVLQVRRLLPVLRSCTRCCATLLLY